MDTDGVNDGLELLLAADFFGAAVSAGTAGVSAAWSAALPSAATTFAFTFALPMVSAGSGAVVPDVVSLATLAVGAASSAGASSMAPVSG